MTITNNVRLDRLEVTVDGRVGFLQYRTESDSLVLLHVEVPEESRGRGIAGELSRTALELAKERGLKVVPVCAYIVAYIQRHPKYSEMVR